MCKPVMGLGVLFIVMAAVVLVAPGLLVDAADWGSRGGQNLAGAMRVGVDLVLASFAPATRYPTGLRIFGIVLVLAGVGVFFLSNEIWAGLMQLGLFERLVVYRLGGGLIGLMLGGFLIHASRPARIQCRWAVLRRTREATSL